MTQDVAQGQRGGIDDLELGETVVLVIEHSGDIKNRLVGGGRAVALDVAGSTVDQVGH